MVAFEDKHLNTVAGTLMRIKQRAATIGMGDRSSWRVGFGLLRHVLDIRPVALVKRVSGPRL